IRHFKSSVGDLLDVVGRPYDSINHVVVHGVTKSDHAVAALREVAQTPENVAADLNLHSGLAKIDIAAILQFKAHHILHNPREARSYRNRKVSRPDAIREVAEDGQCWLSPAPLQLAARPKARARQHNAARASRL